MLLESKAAPQTTITEVNYNIKYFSCLDNTPRVVYVFLFIKRKSDSKWVEKLFYF